MSATSRNRRHRIEHARRAGLALDDIGASHEVRHKI
jgi:hypothetical protein